MDHESHIAIQQLLALYCHILDAKAWNRLTEIFTPDAVYDSTSIGFGVQEGLPALIAHWKRIDHPLAHHVMSIVIDDRGDGTADVLSKGLFAWPHGLSGGDYKDVAIKTNDGWRLSRRAYTRRWFLKVPPAEGLSLVHPDK
jgi:hypothetical protein